jgi:hypothetical protein
MRKRKHRYASMKMLVTAIVQGMGIGDYKFVGNVVLLFLVFLGSILYQLKG